jgi:hypothetical protein
MTARAELALLEGRRQPPTFGGPKARPVSPHEALRRRGAGGPQESYPRRALPDLQDA